MAITASVQPKSGRIVYAGSDFPHPFQFHFSKEGMDHIVQNRPGSDPDGLARVWLNTSGLEASRCAGIMGPAFWQDAVGSGMFTARLEHPPKWCTYTAVLLLHGWCHVELLPSRRTFCVHRTTITPGCNVVQSHISRVHVCLAVTTITFGRMTGMFDVLLR